jgi:hypothetical protein
MLSQYSFFLKNICQIEKERNKLNIYIYIYEKQPLIKIRVLQEEKHSC